MFNKIDLTKWPRAEMFHYFSQMAPTGYSMTVDVDITNVIKEIRDKRLKFFPAYLWLITKNLNKQQEFKCAIKDGELGYYDTLTPMYASWHDDTKTFSFMWSKYSDSFDEFYEEYCRNQIENDEKHGILGRAGMPPENAYTVSAIPWVEFTHFSVHSYENKPYFLPSIEAGKFKSAGERIIMPLSITCHHATTDGWHVSRFLDDLENDIKHFSEIV